MKMFQTMLLSAALVAVMASRANSQTAAAVDPSATVAAATRLAASLVDTEDGGSPSPFLRGNVVVHGFGKPERDSAAHLRQGVAGYRVVAARTYVGVPATLANDLCADFRDAEIPDAVKRVMIPAAEADLTHANLTASRWIDSALSPSSTDVVGVIVLTAPGAATDAGKDQTGTASSPVFILVKFVTGAQGRLVPKLIVYGDPR